MPICMMIHNPDQTPEQAREVLSLVRQSGPVPPEGARLMVGGPAERGMHIISVWDNEDAIEKFFSERLGPAQREAGVTTGNSTRKIFEVTALVAGDLTGAGQPA
jgi:hypothetical protein